MASLFGQRIHLTKIVRVLESACLPVLLIILIASNASAHNVVSGVYADGMIIEGEIGYSNGDMAEAGSPVQVLDENGDLITELVLNEGGAFIYEAKTATKHVFKANLSAGHVAEMIVEADEIHLPMGHNILSVAKAAEASTKLEKPESSLIVPSDQPNSTAATSPEAAANDQALVDGVTVEQLESIIRTAVAQQIRPLQKELNAYKEKVMVRDIAGGLGFIFGLFGVAAWMASRRKQGDGNATVS